MGYASKTPSQAFAALAQAAQARKTGQASKEGRQARLLFSCLLPQADAPKAVQSPKPWEGKGVTVVPETGTLICFRHL